MVLREGKKINMQYTQFKYQRTIKQRRGMNIKLWAAMHTSHINIATQHDGEPETVAWLVWRVDGLCKL